MDEKFKERVDKSILRAVYMQDSKELKKLCKFSPKITDLGPFWNSNAADELIEVRRDIYKKKMKEEKR
jgi:hypothetical protein